MSTLDGLSVEVSELICEPRVPGSDAAVNRHTTIQFVVDGVIAR